MITTLRITKNYNSSLDLAIKWYGIISVLNDFKWAPLEIKLMAFTAIKGDISSGGRKDAFCELFGSSKGSVTNTISALYKGHFLIKDEGKIKVHPQLVLNFEADILSQIKLLHV